MTTLSMKEVVKLGLSVGLSRPAAVTAAAIAKAESSLRTDAVGDTTIQTGTWGPSIGLWQIRSLKAEKGTGSARDASRLTNPAFNARSMAAISNHGANFSPWSTYKDRSYKKYIPEAVNAAGGGVMAYGDDWSSGGATLPGTGGGSGEKSSSGGYRGSPVAGGRGGVSPVDFDLPGPDGLYGPGGLLAEGLINGAGGAIDGAVDDLRAAVLVGLVWTAALGLGVSLVLIGSWRLAKSTVS